MNQMKRCTKCGEDKPATPDVFPKNLNLSDGLGSWCRKCAAKNCAGWYQKNREKVLAAQRVAYQANPESKKANALRWKKENPERRAARNRAWYKKHPEKVLEAQKRWVEARQRWAATHPVEYSESLRRANLKRSYGLTLEDYEAMFKAQGGCCANPACRSAFLPGKNPDIDHDHATNKLRALLCHNCNMMLGHAKDDPERLRGGAAYLESWKKFHAEGPSKLIPFPGTTAQEQTS